MTFDRAVPNKTLKGVDRLEMRMASKEFLHTKPAFPWLCLVEAWQFS